MPGHRDFLTQLENFRHEAYAAAQYLYSDMAVQHAASKSRRLLDRLNLTPSFWLTHSAGMQAAAYVTIGRVFDTTSRYNINALLDSFEASLDQFSRTALAERKRDGRKTDPEWLAEYLNSAHYPDQRDVARMRAKVAEYRQVYDRAVKPARHKYIAHREKQAHSEVEALFAGGKVRELWRMVTFFYALYNALWEQYFNGRRPLLRPARYSVRAIYESADRSRSGPHEIIVSETRKLMEFLEQATIAKAPESTRGSRRRPR
jgi:hypothetical protein